MLLIVAFAHVELLRRMAVKGCVLEEGDDRLSPSSTSVAGRLEQLNLNTQT